MPSVLIVDDLISIHGMLEAVIQPTGFSTAFATDGEKALVRYKQEKFDIVLADIDMKPMDGITLLKQLKQYDPNAVVTIMTAYASTESAVQALKFGAFDYLTKPFKVDELIATLRRAIEFRNLQLERGSAMQGAGVPDTIDSRLIGSSPAIKKIVQQLKKLASATMPVLLQGEIGTGKSTVAELIHETSHEKGAPYVAIDCNLSPEENLRVGLIGVNGEGGSWVEQAKGGTLFLRHVQCLPAGIQQDMVGVLRSSFQNIRLICSTAENLERMTDEGRYHEELFYRIASLPVHLPPLRERIEDLPALVRHYLASATNPNFDARLIEFTADAMAVLAAYHWPGNLTELQQVVTNIGATSESRVVTSKEMPLRLRELQKWPSLAEYLAGQEKHYIDRVLHACQNDKAAAGRVLGIDESKLG